MCWDAIALHVSLLEGQAAVLSTAMSCAASEASLGSTSFVQLRSPAAALSGVLLPLRRPLLPQGPQGGRHQVCALRTSCCTLSSATLRHAAVRCTNLREALQRNEQTCVRGCIFAAARPTCSHTFISQQRLASSRPSLPHSRLQVEILIAIADQTNAYEIAEEMTQVSKGQGWAHTHARLPSLQYTWAPALLHLRAACLPNSNWMLHMLECSFCSCLQYVKDVDEDLARAAIRAVGQIALKARGTRRGILHEQLVGRLPAAPVGSGAPATCVDACGIACRTWDLRLSPAGQLPAGPASGRANDAYCCV